MKKRILAFLLCVCMIASLLPVIATAEEAATDKPTLTFVYQILESSSGTTNMNAGDATAYFITGNVDSTAPNKYYVSRRTEFTEADNWNIKLEYPADGNPVMTLRNAKLYNQNMIKITTDAPFTLVVEGENNLTASNLSNPPLEFRVPAGVTITGDGVLNLRSNNYGENSGVIANFNGGLTFDGAKINLDMSDTAWGDSNAIIANGGDIVIKGGKMFIDGSCANSTTNTMLAAFRAKKTADGTAGGNLTIQDNAKVTVIGTVGNRNGVNNAVEVEGKVTIKNSDVELASVFAGNSMFNDPTTLEVEFAGDYYVTTATSRGTYDPESGLFIPPAAATTVTDIADVSLVGQYYFRISPNRTAKVSYINTSNKSTTLSLTGGDDAKYFTTGEYNEEKVGYSYMKPTADTENWNVKLEYPADGVPTATFKNANLACVKALHFGTETDPYVGDVKIILEGTNTITAKNDGTPSLAFYIVGDATITGPGKLILTHTATSRVKGIIYATGDLIFDNTNVDITIPAKGSSSGHGIVAMGGDIIIKGGRFFLEGLNPYYRDNSIWTSYRPVVYAIWATKTTDGTAGGSLIVKDNALVQLVASSDNASVSYYGKQADESICLEGKFAVSNSVVTLAVTRGTYLNLFVSHLPELDFAFDDGYKIVYRPYGTSYHPSYNTETDRLTCPNDSRRKTLTNTAPTADNLAKTTYFKIMPIHTCVAGEPVYEGGSKEICATLRDKVTYCTICDTEMTREKNVAVPNENLHTPTADWVENTQKYVAATLKTPGKYVFEKTCTVCGEVLETKEQAYEAGIFWWRNGDSEGWISGSSEVSDAIVLLPGDVKYYKVVNAGSTVRPLRDNIIAGDENDWSIKLEYPRYGNPKMTLKNLTMANATGIFYGIGAYQAKAPLDVIIEGQNTIHISGQTNEHFTSYGALSFATQETVTITGGGKLTAMCDVGGKYGIIDSYGDIIIDNVDMDLTLMTGKSTAGMGIMTTGGDITIKSSNVNIIGWSKPADGQGYYTATESALWIEKDATTGLGGNLNILDDSYVLAFGDPSNGSYGNCLIYMEGNLTIKESTFEAALSGKYCYQPIFNGSHIPTVETSFADGYKVTTGGACSYTPTTDGSLGVLVRPANTTTVKNTIPNLGSGGYIKIYSDLKSFAGASVTLGSTLDMHFGIDKTVTGTDGYVEFVKNGETTKVSLADCEADENFYILTFPGVAAKEMKDTITVTVYDAAGNPVSQVYSDSIAAYAMRMLRGEKPKDHTDEQFAALKTLLVDMLNYGAEAQTFFGYNADQLVNADLTDDEKALASAEMKALTTEERAIEGEGYLATSFVLESDIAMLIALDKEVTGTGSYALVTFTDHYGNVTTQKKIAALDTDTHTEFRFDGLAAADARYDVTWEIYTAEDAKIATVTDSLEKYIARCIDAYDWMAQIMIYADSAYAYWHFNA